MTRLAFVDTETLGLNPDRHAVWEVALVLREGDEDGKGHEEQYLWHLPLPVGRPAQAAALAISGFEDRYRNRGLERLRPDVHVALDHSLRAFSEKFGTLTFGAHLVGAVPSFDEERLRRLMLAEGVEPGWYYHLIDVEALVAGRLGVEPPWVSDDLANMVGVTLSPEEKHTALGDARWAARIYDAVMRDAHEAARGR